MVIAVIALISMVGVIELKGFAQQRQWKVFCIYFLLLVGGTGLLVANMLDVEIPSPYYLVVWLFDPVSSLIFPSE